MFGVDVRDTVVNFSGVHRHVHSVIAAVRRPIQPNVSPGSAFASSTRRRSSRTATQSLPATSNPCPPLRDSDGSKPALPAISGLDSGPYLTNENIFDLTERPEHLIIIGAGSTGLELAQGFRRLEAP